MATRTPGFVAVPTIPQVGIDPWQYYFLNSIKENIELLTGQRGDLGAGSRAVAKSQISVNAAPEQKMTRITAEGAGISVSGAQVPSLDDYAKLLSNVQELANDVAALRGTLNLLISQIKA